MLNAAKSFRLAFRRASVGKSPADRKHEDDQGNHKGASTTREPSENQACENERDVELLYAKLRRVLDKPRFSRLSAATRARVLERLAQEEHPASLADSYMHPPVRERAQSTMVSERSLTFWDDQGEQPETVESDTEVDDLVTVTASATRGDELTGTRANCDVRKGPLGQFAGGAHRARCDGESIAIVKSNDETDVFVSSAESPDMLNTAIQQSSSHRNISPTSVDETQDTKRALLSGNPPQIDRADSHGVLAPYAIVALRSVPFLEACTDDQLIEIYHSSGCSHHHFACGDEISVDRHGPGVLLVVVEGTVIIDKRRPSTITRNTVPSTIDSRLQVLSAPAYIFSKTQEGESGDEGEAGTLLAESPVWCLIIASSAFQERLLDVTELVGGQHPRAHCVPSSLRRFVSDFTQTVLEGNLHECDDIQLKLMKAEANEIDADTILIRMLRVVEDRLGGGSVALFVIDPRGDRMTRLQVQEGASAVTANLPMCGLAGLTARNQIAIHVREPSTDSRFSPVIDVKTTHPLMSIPLAVKLPKTDDMKPVEIGCVLQFTPTSWDCTTQPSVNDAKVYEVCATRICSFFCSRQSRCGDNMRSISAIERMSISITSLCVPLSALPTVSASTPLIAVVSMRFYYGEEELTRRTSIVSSRAMVDEDNGIAQFDFAERLMANDGNVLDYMPLATRVVLEMSINCKSTPANSFLRRRSTMFQSFSNSMALNPGTVTPRQHSATSRSSISMSQSLTEAEECSVQSDATTGTVTLGGRETLLTGWSGFFLYGQSGEVQSGELSLGLWTDSKNIPPPNRQSGLEDPERLCVLQLHLFGSEYHIERPSSWSGIVPHTRTVHREEEPESAHEEVALAALKGRLLIDPFYRLSQGERELLWRTRHRHIPFDSRMLPGLLLAVDWKNPHAVCEVYGILEVVDVLHPPELALRLLGSQFPDPRVREYAVRCLEALDAPQDVGLFMMQLVQALQHESFHDSALARFLLREALTFSDTLGHQFYWLLKADMHQSKIRERYKVLLDIYLTHTTSSERTKLRNEHLILRQLEHIHGQVAQCSTMEDKQSTLVAALRKMDLPMEFVLPLDPTRKLGGIEAEECRVLGSKKKPFYLVFKVCSGSSAKSNADNSRTLHVLYKSGDDLRQDQLVLQLFRVMNRIWSRSGSSSPMKLVSYGCVSTGPKSGMIEVVRDAETIASIFSMKTQRARGSQRGSTHHKFHSALSVLTEQDALTEWLMLHSLPPASISQQRTFQKLHRASLSERHFATQIDPSISRDMIVDRLTDSSRNRVFYEEAVRNFATSCAASCIASYVLGIGDRHNDNIMVSHQGHLFHIDFGHIMGNFKKKFGVKRERTMFVFTPAFAAVLMSEGEDQCHNISPQTVAVPVNDGDEEQTIVKKRETTFLKHLKHAGHSKSCHLESAATVEERQESQATKASGVGDTSVDTGAQADRRLVWQRSIHASLRFSPRQTSKLDPSTDSRRRDSIQPSQRVPAYELFTQLCCDGYNAVRHHVDLLYDLCMLMTSSSLPELQHQSDLEWLRAQLLLGETDDKASAHFLKLIKHSVVSRATLLNDAAHMLKHG